LVGFAVLGGGVLVSAVGSVGGIGVACGVVWGVVAPGVSGVVLCGDAVVLCGGFPAAGAPVAWPSSDHPAKGTDNTVAATAYFHRLLIVFPPDF